MTELCKAINRTIYLHKKRLEELKEHTSILNDFDYGYHKGKEEAEEEIIENLREVISRYGKIC